MSDSKITPADLEAILKLVQSAEHLGDFHLKYGDLELRVSRTAGGHGLPAEAGGTGSAPAALPPAASASIALAPTAPASRSNAPFAPNERDAVAPGMAVVKAPMVGTFYRAPSPGAKPFVEVGDTVEPDTVVCIIEVMKLMNTLHAGVAGTVRQIRVENSQPVEFGQVLLVIEPDR